MIKIISLLFSFLGIGIISTLNKKNRKRNVEISESQKDIEIIKNATSASFIDKSKFLLPEERRGNSIKG